MSSGERQLGFSNLINFNRVAAGLSAVVMASAVSGCGSSESARMASVPESAMPDSLRWGSNGLPGLSFIVNKQDAQSLDCGERYVSAGSWAYNRIVGQNIEPNEKDVYKYSQSQSLVVCGGLAVNNYRIIDSQPSS